MGGVKKYPYPKWVYTPTGGWWGQGSHKNTAFRAAVFGTAVALGWVFVFRVSAGHERRSIPLRPAPSQRWGKHTLDDDPDYYQKLQDYHANKPSFWSRIKPDPAH